MGSQTGPIGAIIRGEAAGGRKTPDAADIQIKLKVIR